MKLAVCECLLVRAAGEFVDGFVFFSGAVNTAFDPIFAVGRGDLVGCQVEGGVLVVVVGEVDTDSKLLAIIRRGDWHGNSAVEINTTSSIIGSVLYLIASAARLNI